MPKNVLVATEKPFAKVAVAGIGEILRDAGYDMTLLESYTDKADYLKAAAAADALIVRSDTVDAEVLEAAPNLKIVVRAGAGYDNIDLKAATARGVVAMNTPGQNSNAVAELVFGLMMTLARRGFSGKAGTELRGKKIGIHAYGNVGKYVAMIARGFGMDVFAFDPYVPAEAMKAEGVTPVATADELLLVLRLHLATSPENEGHGEVRQRRPAVEDEEGRHRRQHRAGRGDRRGGPAPGDGGAAGLHVRG